MFERNPVPVEVTYLFLDLETCRRCRGTETSLEEALALARPVLAALGREARLTRIHVTNAAQAKRLGLNSSPTVRVNGRDVAPELAESPCRDCGDIAGVGTDCREWHWRGRSYTAAPVGLLLEALLVAALEPPAAGVAARERPQSLPANLKRFFATRERGGKGPSSCC